MKKSAFSILFPEGHYKTYVRKLVWVSNSSRTWVLIIHPRLTVRCDEQFLGWKTLRSVSTIGKVGGIKLECRPIFICNDYVASILFLICIYTNGNMFKWAKERNLHWLCLCVFFFSSFSDMTWIKETIWSKCRFRGLHFKMCCWQEASRQTWHTFYTQAVNVACHVISISGLLRCRKKPCILLSGISIHCAWDLSDIHK